MMSRKKRRKKKPAEKAKKLRKASAHKSSHRDDRADFVEAMVEMHHARVHVAEARSLINKKFISGAFDAIELESRRIQDEIAAAFIDRAPG